ncbi:MAG: hypothetical protein ACI81T_002925 [Bacteroidia bacterium]|jgi:uncharacterized protein (TIRG00374 family)
MTIAEKKESNLKKYILGAFGILISIGAIYLLFQKIDVEKSVELLKTVPTYYYFLLIPIYLSGFFVRAFRWKLMLKSENVSFRNCLDSIVIGFAGNNIIPARGGELLRMFFFSKKTNVNKLTAISSIGVEKILDGVALISILVITLLLQPSLMEIDWLQKLTYTVSLFVVLLLVVLIILRIYSDWIINFITEKKLPLHKLLAGIIEKIADALKFLKWDKSTAFILILSIVIWLIEGAMFPLGIQAFGVTESTWLIGFFMLAIVNFGLVVPSSPGYVGVFQAMTVVALLLFSIPEETALSIGILIHLCQFIPITIWGILVFLIRGMK